MIFSQTKICNLWFVVVIQKDVRCLDVTMDDLRMTVFVQIGEALR